MGEGNFLGKERLEWGNFVGKRVKWGWHFVGKESRGSTWCGEGGGGTLWEKRSWSGGLHLVSKEGRGGGVSHGEELRLRLM